MHIPLQQVHAARQHLFCEGRHVSHSLTGFAQQDRACQAGLPFCLSLPQALYVQYNHRKAAQQSSQGGSEVTSSCHVNLFDLLMPVCKGAQVSKLLSI